jgi:hypothetical protein
MKRGKHLQTQGLSKHSINMRLSTCRCRVHKFDVVILVESGSSQPHDQASRSAYVQYEQSCRFLFRKDPKDVPAEIVQGTLLSVPWRVPNERICVVVKSQLGDLIDGLVVTTDRLLKGLPSRSFSSPPPGIQWANLRIPPVYLAWSAALRAYPHVIIQASIEYVDSLLNLISFTYLIPRVGQSRKYIQLAKLDQYLQNHNSFRILA